MFNIHKFLNTLQEGANDGSGNGGGTSGGADGGDNGGDGGGETLLAGKYKTAPELEAGYMELQTSYSGKDEAHKAELLGLKSPEEFTAGEGWSEDNPTNNRMMSVFKEIAKEHNMPQGMYEGLVNGMTEMQDRVQKDQIADTIKSIPNYETRSSNMQNMALKFLRPDQAQAMDTLMQTKESFEAVEVILNQLRGGSLPTDIAQSTAVTDSELRAQIKKLDPSDSKERARLMALVSERNSGEGKLI